MNTTKQISVALHNVFGRVRCGDDGLEVVLTWSVGKSVFRAILARVATLCNEQSANSVSPYGGQGELVVGD